MSSKITADLATFVTTTAPEALPNEAVEKAKKVIVDTVAVTLAGAGSEVSAPLLDHIERMSPGPVAIPGTTCFTSPPVAALASGTFAAALDFDDVLSMMPGHPAAVIISALSAYSYVVPMSGAEFIDAYIIGLEVGSKLSQGVGLEHYHKGFHTTGSIAIFCGVGALARVTKLSQRHTQMALSLAASTASGIQANFGTMTKPFHSGWAAQSSVLSVDLVRSGFTASVSALEDSGGYFSAYGTSESDPKRVQPTLGNPWTIVDPGIALKKWPTCYATHRAIDAVYTIEGKVGRLIGKLTKLVCHVPPGTMRPLRFDRAETGLEGKFSMRYSLAAALFFPQLKISSFSDDAVKLPEISRLYEKIEILEGIDCVAEDPEYQKKSAGTRGFIRVEVFLEDGSSLECRVDIAPGHPSRALSWNDLHQKLLDCADSCGVDIPTAESTFSSLIELEKLNSISSLFNTMRPSLSAS